MTIAINIPGFTQNDEGRVWTADAKWGLTRNEEGKLQLLDSEGFPCNQALTDADARQCLEGFDLTGDNVGLRWDWWVPATVTANPAA